MGMSLGAKGGQSANINVTAGGTVNITVTNTAGAANAVLSGVFLG